MGFPCLAAAGLVPRLFVAAAMSIDRLTDLCASFLKRLGININNSINDQYVADSDQRLGDLEEQEHAPANHSHYYWYFNPHLQTPFDRRLLLCHTAFSDAVRASLPIVLYRSFPLSSTTTSLVSPSASCSTTISSTSAPSLCILSSPATTTSSSCDLSPTLYRSTTSSSSSSSNLQSLPSSSSSLQSSVSASTMLMAQPHAREHEQPESQTLLQTSLQMAVSDQCKEACYHSRECAICLCEFEEEQEVRELPECRHIFHKDCIDGWILHNHHTCPLCRCSLLTTDVALQECCTTNEVSSALRL